MSRNIRREAYSDLLHRYMSVFTHFWRHRDQLGGTLLTEQEAEFLPAALSLQARPVSPAARILAMLMVALVMATLGWSFFGRIDIIVNATGKIIPSGYTKTIASVDVASVKALHVEEGQQVKAGDVLIELDASASDSERDKASGNQAMALLQAARAKAMITAIDQGRPPQMPLVDNAPADQWQTAQQYLDGQYRDYAAKLSRVDSNIEHYRQALALATQRAEDYKELLLNHDVSQHAWLEKEQARVDLTGQLSDARNQRSTLVAETRRAAYDQLTEGTKAAASSLQDALRSSARSRLLKLTAPVSGTVQQLDIHTVGGVVSAARPLMQIVPKDAPVEVEALIENKDVGFVRDGQDVAIKIDAFEYTKYGTVTGKVSHVSRDAIKDEKRGLIYSVKIALNKSIIAVEGKEMPLSAGMSVNVEIKTGDRRVIEYVLSPLMRHQRESLNER